MAVKFDKDPLDEDYETPTAAAEDTVVDQAEPERKRGRPPKSEVTNIQVIDYLDKMTKSIDDRFFELSARLDKMEKTRKPVGDYFVGDVLTFAVQELGIREPQAQIVRNVEPEGVDYVITAYDSIGSSITGKRDALKMGMYDQGVSLYDKYSEEFRREAAANGDVEVQKYFELRDAFDKVQEYKEELADKTLLMTFLVFNSLDVPIPATVQNELNYLVRNYLEQKKTPRLKPTETM